MLNHFLNKGDQMKELDKIQQEHKLWIDYNFPNALPHQSIFGAMEELGELAQACLKQEQGIRFSYEECQNKKKDAIGDLIIFLFHQCNLNNWQLSDIIQETWDVVSKRDWQRNKENGKV